MQIRSSAHGIEMGCHVNRAVVCDFLGRYEIQVDLDDMPTYERIANNDENIPRF